MLLIFLLTVVATSFCVEPYVLLDNNLIVGKCNGQKVYQEDVTVAGVSGEQQKEEVRFSSWTYNNKNESFSTIFFF